MSNEFSRDDIDFSRGDEDIVFVYTEIDTEELENKHDPREELLSLMEEKGLETENVRVIGIFKDEFSLLLEENAKIKLDGEVLWPK